MKWGNYHWTNMMSVLQSYCWFARKNALCWSVTLCVLANMRLAWFQRPLPQEDSRSPSSSALHHHFTQTGCPVPPSCPAGCAAFWSILIPVLIMDFVPKKRGRISYKKYWDLVMIYFDQLLLIIFWSPSCLLKNGGGAASSVCDTLSMIGTSRNDSHPAVM